MNGYAILLIVALAGSAYFLPYIVASNRDHHHRTAIGLLNLLTGWTFVGWVAALVWATTNQRGAS